MLSLFLTGGLGWIAQDRGSRQQLAEHVIKEALELGEPLLKNGNPNDPELISAVRKAEAQLAHGLANSELQRRVLRMRADRDMLVHLEQARLARSTVLDGHFNLQAGVDAYANAFRQYGIDVQQDPPDVVADNLRTRTIRVDLVAAIDDWASLLRQLRQLEKGKRLVEVSRRINTDEWSSRLREVLRSHDEHELANLVREASVDTLPVATVVSLAEALLEVQMRREAIELLRRAQPRHPDNFWINQHLGRAFVQSQRYSFADSSLFAPSFVAFYADCYHEVKPITAGYRLCVVYNLAITNRKKQPVLSQQMGPIEDINKAIQAWSQATHDNSILTYLLDHSYSEQNLSMANLKHGDFAKASVLLHAAANSGCQAYLCLATYYRTSYGEVESYGRRGRRGRYTDYDDDVEESDFEEYDVNEELVYAHAFVTADGTKINVKKILLDADDLLAKVPLVDGPGRGYAISEATGNEGATKDLWYHRGAVIMWPKERELDLVAKMDVDYGIHVLKRSMQDQHKLEGSTVNNSFGWPTILLRPCHPIARRIYLQNSSS